MRKDKSLLEKCIVKQKEDVNALQTEVKTLSKVASEVKVIVDTDEVSYIKTETSSFLEKISDVCKNENIDVCKKIKAFSKNKNVKINLKIYVRKGKQDTFPGNLSCSEENWKSPSKKVEISSVSSSSVIEEYACPAGLSMQDCNSRNVLYNDQLCVSSNTLEQLIDKKQ